MIFCCETEDFETFGDVRLYVNEIARTGKSNYTCIDASQIRVDNKDGTYNIFRVIKDESDNHVNLEMSDSVLDPDMDYSDKTLSVPDIHTGFIRVTGKHVGFTVRRKIRRGVFLTQCIAFILIHDDVFIRVTYVHFNPPVLPGWPRR